MKEYLNSDADEFKLGWNFGENSELVIFSLILVMRRNVNWIFPQINWIFVYSSLWNFRLIIIWMNIACDSKWNLGRALVIPLFLQFSHLLRSYSNNFWSKRFPPKIRNFSFYSPSQFSLYRGIDPHNLSCSTHSSLERFHAQENPRFAMQTEGNKWRQVFPIFPTTHFHIDLSNRWTNRSIIIPDTLLSLAVSMKRKAELLRRIHG